MKFFLSLLFLCFFYLAGAQQSQLLFQTHYLGESNFMNPAVQSECKWFIGLPLLSSVHLNYANSGFTYKQLITEDTDSSYLLNVDETVDQLGRRTLIGTEAHVSLLALGYQYQEYYLAFSIIEKNNLPFTFPRDMFLLGWEGNSQFEGESASLKGTGAYLMHYREYALGVSKSLGGADYAGIKAKLLFGKFNVSSQQFDVDLHTDADNFNLSLDADIRMNTSGPIYFDDEFNSPDDIHFDEEIPLRTLLFNRKNWGLAFDAGFIRQLDDRTRLSGSILDIGFIRWRSYQYNLTANESAVYEGILADTNNVLNNILDSINFEVSQKPYTTMLPTKAYLGVNYKVSEKLDAQATASGMLYRTKFTPALTFSLDYNPFGHFHLLGSYSLFYRSFNNFGAGFSLGRGPVQIYLLSDNIAGIIRPANTRNINLRFGLNINLGCSEENDAGREYQSINGPCPVYDDNNSQKRKKRKRR